MCAINQDHMMYGSWDMKCNRKNFFVILGDFFPFYSPNSLKNENINYNNKKKEKKAAGDIIILHKCNKNRDHLLYCSWDMAHDGCNFYFHFGLYFSLLLPWQPKNENFKKMRKNSWRYHHLTQVYQKSWSHAFLFMRYDTWHM